MRWVLACIFWLITVSSVLAASSVSVTTVETGKITNYFNEYWVVNVDGTLSVNNPTARDLYNIAIRYDILSLSLIETSNTSDFKGDQVVISRIPPNSTVQANYNIVGITLSDPALAGKGVLYTGMTKFVPIVYSDTFGQLQKASLENPLMTGRSGRLVSVTLQNPTGFQFTVNSLKVIKTPDLNPNTVLDQWQLVNESNPITVDPDALFVRDILDKNSADGQVYWLVADVFISKVNFYDFSNVTRYTQDNLTVPPELLNYTLNETNQTNMTLPALNELYVKKLADRQMVTLDSPVTLSFIINNFAQKLIPFTITDTLPPGFLFKEGNGWSEQNGKIVYSGTISAKNAMVLSYTAQLNDSDTAGLDYFDAAKADYTVDGDGKTIYSNTVPFVRQYLPPQKLYIQKRITYEDKDQVGVTLTLQNLGTTSVSNLLVKEYLSDSDVFSQITQMPAEKGLWDISTLKPGDSWEVSYLTTKDAAVSILPGVYGVSSKDVLKSLVLESVISTAWQAVKTTTLEIIGIGLLLGLPLVYYFTRKKQTV